MTFGDFWFIASAGHVLQKLDRLVSHPRVRVDYSYIVDSLGSDAKYENEIPFSYAGSDRYAVYDEEPKYNGLDYGLIHLNPNTKRLIQANNKRPIAIENWMRQDVDRCKGFVLIGIPAQLVEPTKQSPSGVTLGALMASVRRLDVLPDGADETEYERFIGDIGPNVGLDSLEGISGGPIIGFYEHEGRTHYWVVALQSRSLYNRYVFGCPVKLFGGLIVEDMARMAERLQAR